MPPNLSWDLALPVSSLDMESTWYPLFSSSLVASGMPKGSRIRLWVLMMPTNLETSWPWKSTLRMSEGSMIFLWSLEMLPNVAFSLSLNSASPVSFLGRESV